VRVRYVCPVKVKMRSLDIAFLRENLTHEARPLRSSTSVLHIMILLSRCHILMFRGWSDLVRVADLPGRRRLRSSSSHQLLVPSFRLTTVGRCTFPVAASLLWNSLPSDIQSSPSLPVFRLVLFYSPSPT